MKHILSLITCFVFFVFETFAQHIDEVRFGVFSSELNHGLTSYDMTKSETYTGQAGQKARRFLPDLMNPFCGTYKGTYGGEITFVMKVDGKSQNYFTGKFAGDETSPGRILLNVEGKEVGSRHGGNEEVFESMGDQVCTGAFYYRTSIIPRTLTDDKTEVVVRLRSTGSYYAYGTPWIYSSYQAALTKATRGIYAVFMHTNPGFSHDPAEVEGETPSYAAAPQDIPASSLSTLYTNQVNAFNDKVVSILNGGNSLGQNAAWNQWEVLGKCYNTPEVTMAYHRQVVVDKLCAGIDQYVRSDIAGTTKADGDWGGFYGRPGNGVAMVGAAISDAFLDTRVDFGKGLVTRRSEWIRIFKASFIAGATSRRTISNQEMFASQSVFGSALALLRLDSVAYKSFAIVGYHHVLESCGIEQFTGNATISANGIASLGIAANSDKGANYFFTTLKGTTHEPGWVSPDCYGNLGGSYVEIYEMTKTYLGGEGDKRTLDVAVKHSKTQSQFTYAWTSDGKRAILAEGFCCVRNKYIPGKPYYGSEPVAGASEDTVLLGYAQQGYKEGFIDNSHINTNNMGAVYTINFFKKLRDNQYSTRMSSSPDQPDYFFADEENGLLTIKNGREQICFNMFYRASGDNKLVVAHQTSDKYERFIEFRHQYSEYRKTGEFTPRGTMVLGWSGDAPDKPVNAFAGQQDSVSLGQAGILDLYQISYNNYFIAMNTTRPGVNKTVRVPANLIGKTAYGLHSGETITLPATMTIAPLTTFVFRVEGDVNAGGLIPGTTITFDKSGLKSTVEKYESFAQKDSTKNNVCVVPQTGGYPHEFFNTFMRALAKAKYMVNSNQVTQSQLTTASGAVRKAYNDLLASTYTYEINTWPDNTYFIKKAGTDLFFTNIISGNTPVFEAQTAENLLAQRWNIQKDGDRYKFTSVLDGRVLNENAYFSTNTYSASWHTMTLYKSDKLCAIQRGGQAGSNYWLINNTTIASNGADQGAPAVFPFELVADSVNEIFGGGVKLTGTIIGSTGSYANNPTTTKESAFDGEVGTAFDAGQGSGAWAGLDLGANVRATVTAVRFAPRSSHPGRMIGGKFQGSNISSGGVSFLSPETFYTLTATPYNGYSSQLVSSAIPYRYVRYIGADGQNCNVAELEFYGKISYVTSVVTQKDCKFSIYKNLSGNSLQIVFQNSSLENKTVQLINLTGRTVKSEIFNGNEGLISLRNLSKGVYLLKISGSRWLKTVKIIN